MFVSFLLRIHVETDKREKKVGEEKADIGLYVNWFALDGRWIRRLLSPLGSYRQESDICIRVYEVLISKEQKDMKCASRALLGHCMRCLRDYSSTLMCKQSSTSCLYDGTNGSSRNPYEIDMNWSGVWGTSCAAYRPIYRPVGLYRLILDRISHGRIIWKLFGGRQYATKEERQKKICFLREKVAEHFLSRPQMLITLPTYSKTFSIFKTTKVIK